MHSLIYQSEAGHACTRTFPASAAEKVQKGRRIFQCSSLVYKNETKKNVRLHVF